MQLRVLYLQVSERSETSAGYVYRGYRKVTGEGEEGMVDVQGYIQQSIFLPIVCMYLSMVLILLHLLRE